MIGLHCVHRFASLSESSCRVQRLTRRASDQLTGCVLVFVCAQVISEATETESALRKELAHALGEQESLARQLESSRAAAAAAEALRVERAAEGAALRAEVATAEAEVGAIEAWAKHAVGSSAALKASRTRSAPEKGCLRTFSKYGLLFCVFSDVPIRYPETLSTLPIL
eukprot:4313530-Pleurochrysis_carterae.AAC.3